MDLNISNDALWKKRMRAPRILRFSIARNNPSIGLIVTNTDGKDKTYLWNSQTGIIEDKPFLDEDYSGVMTPDGKYFHFMKDKKGNHLGHRWRMNVETGETEDLTPDLPEYFGHSATFSNNSGKLAFIASVGKVSDLYVLSFDKNGDLLDRKKIASTVESVIKPFISPDGEIVTFSSTENGKLDTFSTFVLDACTGDLLNKFTVDDHTCAYPRIVLPNSTKIVILIEKDSVEKGYIWDYQTARLEELPLENTCTNDIADISLDGTKLLVCQMSKARQKFFLYDIQSKTSIFLETTDGLSTSYQIAGKQVFIRNSCSGHKSRVMIYNISTSQLTSTLELPGSTKTSQASEVTFIGALGDTIHGWLKVPQGKGPFPTIIEMPGGPDCAWDWYDSEVYIEHGFARLYFSYHGGMTFGEEFRKSIIGRVGELELEDMVAARNWLVEQGIANPDQVFLMGGSYGGYLTLLGMVKRPDLWRGGLARVPIADFAMTVEEESGSLRSLDIELFGGTPEQVPERYRKSSPITYVENLSAPLQIIAGKHDTNCPRRQNEAFIAKAKALGKDVEEYWFDEGHGSSVIDEQIHQVELRLKFLKRVLDK